MIHLYGSRLIQLAFHDCLRYEDGSGGCDGCLNWAGMGYSSPRALDGTFKKHPELVGAFTKNTHTSNNKLQLSARSLELIYTLADWPPGAKGLPTSLKESGKSRSDLWQFAALVALERTIERANRACDLDFHVRQQVRFSLLQMKKISSMNGKIH